MRQLQRLLAFLFLLAALSMALATRTEITGANAAVQIASTGTARWVQFVADPGNTGAVRVGDSTVTSTSGARLAPGAGLMLPPQGAQGPFYDLSTVYAYVATGDKVSVLWGN